MNTQLFNQRSFAVLLPAVTLAMNALSLVIYWVGAAIVNNVSVADITQRLSTFSDIVVFGTYATYVIMSIMMMVMIIMLIPAAQVSAQRINAVLVYGREQKQRLLRRALLSFEMFPFDIRVPVRIF